MGPVSPVADRNLLFGLLALQMDFVTREQLLEAMNAWMLAKGSPLGEILCRRGVLAEDDREDLDRLVLKHVKRHGGDPQASLAAVRVEPALRRSLARLDDADVHASIARWGNPADIPIDGTIASASLPSFASVRYRRLRSHARGGLGEVFVALDDELKREVALKEIQDRHADQPEARARFVREAKVTGKLEHPGIVPVYGLGAYPDGRPFYAMRLIHGEALSEAIARFHQAGVASRRSRGERSLALRELLERFIAVCNAVAYAHARGAIHRDLKPANVMLGDYGETLIVDWGLARLIDKNEVEATEAEPLVRLGEESTTATVMGEVVGTPAFMAPEQALGQHDRVGPATDGFALGAMLYAMLTGQAPYSGGYATEILQQAQRAVAPPARQRNPEVPRALEAVCRRAMAAMPQHRYPSAQALADEVRRWLADEPVNAYREPIADRLRRWGRHNRSVVTAGVVLLLAGVVGLGGGLWAVQREKARTDEALKVAEANLKLARRAVDQCFNVAATDDLFQQPRMEKAKKLLLAQTLPFYRDFITQSPDDPALQAEEAEQWSRVARIEHVLARPAAAREAYGQALALWNKLVQNHPQVPEFQQALATTHNNLGNQLDALGNRDEAAKEYEQARDLLLRLTNLHPVVPDYQHVLAGTYHNLGHLHRALGQREEALREYQQARSIQKRLVAAHPKEQRYQRNLAGTHNNLGGVLASTGKSIEAVEEYEQAKSLRIRLLTMHPDSPDYKNDLAGTHNNLGNLLATMNQREQAEKEYQQARALRTELVHPPPQVPQYQRDLAATHNNLAKLLDARGKRESALREYELARKLLRVLVGSLRQVPEYRKDLAVTHTNLGNLLSGMGKQEEALSEYQQARARFDELVKSHPQVPEYVQELARTCLSRAQLLSKLSRMQDCLGDLDQGVASVDHLHRLEPGNSWILPFLRFGLVERALIQMKLGKVRQADKDWERVLVLVPTPQRPGLRIQRAVSRARAGDYLRSSAEADEVAPSVSNNGPALFNLACAQSLNAARADHDPRRPLPERNKRAEEFARAAVALLRQAATAKLFRTAAIVGHLDNEDDLAGLRDREDYRSFRAGLGLKKP